MKLQFNSTILKLRFIILFCALLLTYSCHKHKSTPVSGDAKVDSLLAKAGDSLNHNNGFAKIQIEKALSISSDSDSYYNAYTSYIRYYFTINSFDTAHVMSNRLLKYADRKA